MNKVFLRIVFASILLTALGYCIAVAFSCGLSRPLTMYCGKLSNFGEFYATHLRGSLFAGFLTLGGFLLSLKTFIIMNMKKEVYESEAYRKRWERMSKMSSKKSKVESLYSPLRDLSTALFAAILFCVITAVSQLTIGLFSNIWTSIFCIWTAIVAVTLLLWCMFIIRANLNSMFEEFDRAAREQNGSVAQD